MAQYSKEELEEFRKKDLRISKSGIVQALITSGLDVNNVNRITGLADEYLKWIWDDNNRFDLEAKKNEAKPVEVPVAKFITWEEIAKEYSLSIPTKEEETILQKITDDYEKSVGGKQIRKGVLLQHIITRFKKYPSKLSSVKTVLENIQVEDLF